jgi:hypothetical protein
MVAGRILAARILPGAALVVAGLAAGGVALRELPLFISHPSLDDPTYGLTSLLVAFATLAIGLGVVVLSRPIAVRLGAAWSLACAAICLAGWLAPGALLWAGAPAFMRVDVGLAITPDGRGMPAVAGGALIGALAYVVLAVWLALAQRTTAEDGRPHGSTAASTAARIIGTVAVSGIYGGLLNIEARNGAGDFASLFPIEPLMVAAMVLNAGLLLLAVAGLGEGWRRRIGAVTAAVIGAICVFAVGLLLWPARPSEVGAVSFITAQLAAPAFAFAVRFFGGLGGWFGGVGFALGTVVAVGIGMLAAAVLLARPLRKGAAPAS